MGKGDGSFGSGRLTLRQVGFLAPNGYKLNLFDSADFHVGKLHLWVCDACGHGQIAKIAVYPDEHRRTRLGRRLLVMAKTAHPGVRWSTSSQVHSAMEFWRRMSEELNERYEPDPQAHLRRCRHNIERTSPLHEAVVRFGN